jgi:hypothetical protein
MHACFPLPKGEERKKARNKVPLLYAPFPHPRPLPLLSHRRTPALRLAGRQAAGGLYRAQSRMVLVRRGARRRVGARRASARRAQLRVARLRQSRRRVPPGRVVRRTEAAGVALGQRGNIYARAADGRGLSRRRDRRPWPQQFRAPGHVEQARRTRPDRGHHRRDRKTLRRAPARLARALDLAVARHARPAARSRLHVFARLVPRRSAGLDEDTQGPHLVGALPAGAQRHSADRRPQAT